MEVVEGWKANKGSDLVHELLVFVDPFYMRRLSCCNLCSTLRNNILAQRRPYIHLNEYFVHVLNQVSDLKADKIS